jgi:hypothetical protein
VRARSRASIFEVLGPGRNDADLNARHRTCFMSEWHERVGAG